MSNQPKKNNGKKLAIIIVAAALIIGVAIYVSFYAGKPSTLSFTYAPIGQLKVDSVQASMCQDCATVDDNGVSYVDFAVTLQNVGDSPIYFQAGSSLPVSVPANSSVLQASSLFCPSNAALIPLEPGQNYTMSFAGLYPRLLLSGGPSRDCQGDVRLELDDGSAHGGCGCVSQRHYGLGRPPLRMRERGRAVNPCAWHNFLPLF